MSKISLILLFVAAISIETSLNAETKTPQKNQPFLYAELPDDMFGPDALCLCEKSQMLYMTVPNFKFGTDDALPNAGAYLVRRHTDGRLEKLLDFNQAQIGENVGCMGLDFGPDGNLYVCDNQYFFNPDYQSRVLRVVIGDEGVPTGQVQVAVEGLKVANAILWEKDRAFVTDTILDEPGKYGSGGIWLFSAEELLLAGTDAAHPTIQVAKRNDPRLILTEDSVDVRGNNCGADGLTRDSQGIYYFGNYGDGAMYRFRFDQDGRPEVQPIHPAGKLIRSVDGICYDIETDKIYVTDSAANAIWAVIPKPWGQDVEIELIWENDDTNGENGLLDLPCECRVVNGTLVIVNQDAPIGETGKNQATDKPYSLSGIKLYPPKPVTNHQ